MYRIIHADRELFLDECKLSKEGVKIIHAIDVKFGFKLWLLKYRLCKKQLYTGKTYEPNLKIDYVSFQLIQELKLDMKFHKIYMDNYYSSVLLFEKLLWIGFYAVGTVKSNRKNLPKNLSKLELSLSQTRIANNVLTSGDFSGEVSLVSEALRWISNLWG